MGKEEAVDLVDGADSVIGHATVRSCLVKGRLHRAVAIVVMRSDGRTVLQQRSKKDPWQAGKWTLSCTGHVKMGESYEDAAHRELLEELGLSARLFPTGKYLLPPIVQGDLTENEWVSLFRTTTDAEVKADPVELESVGEFGPRQLRRMMTGEGLTPDAVILLKEHLRSTASRRKRNS